MAVGVEVERVETVGGVIRAVCVASECRCSGRCVIVARGIVLKGAYALGSVIITARIGVKCGSASGGIGIA